MIYTKTLKNGIRVIVKKIDGLHSVTAGILVGAGACIETDAEDGISHFIEHMTFKGTQTLNASEISDAFDAIGAQVNAFTGKDLTCYYVKSISQHFEKAFSLLSDLFLHSVYPAEEMEREKNVILEEISMNEDTPEDLCLDLLGQAYYGPNGYGRNILGPGKNVSRFTAEDIDRYRTELYVPANIVISFAGAVDEREAVALAEAYFSALPQTDFVKRPVAVSLQGQSLFRRKEIEQLHLGIAFPSVRREDELFYPTALINSALGGSMSSRLFQEVREKLGLAYSVYSYMSTYSECGTLTVYAGLNPKNERKAVEAIRTVIDRICKDGITDEELQRGKEQMKSGTIFAQESTSSQMLLYGKQMLYRNEVYDFDAKMREIDAVTQEAVRAALEVNFDRAHMAISAVGKLGQPVVY